MIGFFSACLNRQLARLRADNARLHIDNCTLRAERAQLLGEVHRLRRKLSEAQENNRRLGIALFESVGHPSVKASVAKRAEQN